MIARGRALVLVLDDGKQHVMLLRLALMQRGYAVVVVQSAEGAVTMMRERNVDALVLTGSLDVARAIFSDARTGGARPTVTVALVDQPEAETDRARGLGVDSVLRRPVDFGELDSVLSAGLAQRASGMRVRVRVPRRARRGVG